MRAVLDFLLDPIGASLGVFALLIMVFGGAGFVSSFRDGQREHHLRAMVAAGTDPMAARCALMGAGAASDELCKQMVARGGCGGQRVEAAR